MSNAGVMWRCLRSVTILVGVITIMSGLNAHAVDSDEVTRLKERIELLETKLQLMELQNDELQKESPTTENARSL